VQRPLVLLAAADAACARTVWVFCVLNMEVGELALPYVARLASVCVLASLGRGGGCRCSRQILGQVFHL
jgi:hypothetical protein